MNIPKLRFKDNNGNDYPQWEKKLIKDILKIYHGKDYKNEPNEKKLYPVLGTGGIITYIDKFLCDWECVLIGRKGTINKPQYMKTPFWSVDTLFYSKPKLKQNPKFQYYLFQNINWKIYDESTGVPSLSASTIEHINRFIPTYAEQEKIASFFSTIDKKIENLTNTITSLENQKKGLLQQIFSQKLRFKDKNGNNYPNWEKKKLGDITTSYSGGTPSVNVKDYYNGTIPFIKSGEIHNSFTETFITETGFNSSSAKLVKKGDLLFALYGATSGDTSISKINGAINQAILCVRSTTLNLHYLYQLLNFYRNKLLSIYLQGGQGNFSATIFKNLIFNFPCLEEQTKIADFLSAFDRKLDNQKAQLEHWQQIKKGLLQQMFV
ncbi:restriction endonuclease subunit S [uncultured Megamonas sp.]|uniref:restriction endonuclease subunit S n=1 Tax=uncultured Megamonas sp. TaxID=286140 RepID=UPI00266F1EAE|nr:restriction endonuclease subunit S [uncultured Megamonas sp.]